MRSKVRSSCATQMRAGAAAAKSSASPSRSRLRAQPSSALAVPIVLGVQPAPQVPFRR